MKKVEIRKLPEPMHTIIKEEINALQPEISNVLHREMRKLSNCSSLANSEPFKRVSCVECNRSIKEVMYICSECSETQLWFCQYCESHGIHSHHILLKVKNRSQFKMAMEIFNINENPEEVPENNNSNSFFSTIFNKIALFSNSMKNLLLQRYPDNMFVFVNRRNRVIIGKPNMIVTAYWEVINRSSMPWPKTILMKINIKNVIKDNNDEDFIEIPHDNIGPGQSCELWLPVSCPKIPGEYNVEIKAMDEDEYEFGENMIVKLQVK